jgi:hypothetical protein
MTTTNTKTTKTARPRATKRTRRVAAATAAVVGLGVLGTAGLSAARFDEPQDDRPSGEALLEAEIATMEEAGLPADHPKMQMLRDDLASLRNGQRVEAPAEPGVDLSDVGTAGGRARHERNDTSLWDDGPVECEPIPPDLLTAEELAGATCRSEPQADGSSLYVATAPDGIEHVVRFGADGSVTRQR